MNPINWTGMTLFQQGQYSQLQVNANVISYMRYNTKSY